MIGWQIHKMSGWRNILAPQDLLHFFEKLFWKRNLSKSKSFIICFTRLSVCLSVRLSIRLTACLPACLSACLRNSYVFPTICLSVHIIVFPSVLLSICLFFCLPVCLPACLPIKFFYLFICLSVHLPDCLFVLFVCTACLSVWLSMDWELKIFLICL